MAKHSLFYYPYASFTNTQLPLLKVAALYFDKLYILDPVGASWDTIGADFIAREAILLLKDAGILEIVTPQTVLEQFSSPLEESIRQDMSDLEFLNLCETHSQASNKQRWTLSLEKVPENFQTDQAMRYLLSDFTIPNLASKLDKARQALQGVGVMAGAAHIAAIAAIFLATTVRSPALVGWVKDTKPNTIFQKHQTHFERFLTMTQQTFQINGRIIDRKTKKGVPDLQIEAWDKDLIFDDLVGNTMTNDRGYFQIEFTQIHYQECFLDRQPDLFFKVFRQGKLLTSTENSVLWNRTTPDTEITIEIELKHTHPVSDEIFRQVYDSPASLPGEYKWLTPNEDVRTIKQRLGMPPKTIGAPLWVSGDLKR